MNLAETARVLAWAAAYDRRTVGEMDVQAWHKACGDLDVDDALEAVTRWYADRADWLMPSHLREAVRLVRADRARAERIKAREQAEACAVPAPRRPYDALTEAEQATLRDLSKGLLERWPPVGELVGERYFAAQPVAIEVDDRRIVYGPMGHAIEGETVEFD